MCEPTSRSRKLRVVGRELRVVIRESRVASLFLRATAFFVVVVVVCLFVFFCVFNLTLTLFSVNATLPKKRKNSIFFRA